MRRFGYTAASFVLLFMAGCSQNQEIRPYHLVPYCCDRTAGMGTEFYKAEPVSPALIEPAAGKEEAAERIFRKSLKK